jgi:capsular polysaccharide biosynthesis protein
MTLQSFGKLLKKRSWIIAVFTIITTVAAGIYTAYWVEPTYFNSSTLLVNERNRQQAQLRVEEVMLYEKLMGTYKDILMSRRILSPVAEKYGKGVTPNNISEYVRVSTKSNSQIITISVYHTDYLIATELANLIASQFRDNLQHIMTVNNVEILDPAIYSEAHPPVKPKKLLNIAVAFFLGLSMSITLVLLVHLLDTRIRSEEDLSGLLTYPLIGSVPNFEKSNGKLFYHN